MPDTYSQIVWKLHACWEVGTISLQGYPLSLLQTFWYQNELPKSIEFCPNMGMGVAV